MTSTVHLSVANLTLPTGADEQVGSPAATVTPTTSSSQLQPNVIESAAQPAPGSRLADLPSASGGHTDHPNQSTQSTQSNQSNQARQWRSVAVATTQGVRQRMSLASDQFGLSLRQLYASASSITDVPPSYHNIPGIVPYYHGRSSGPPPSYDDVVNPFAPPPTYQSLFGQMREARKSSRGLLDLLRRLLIILVSTLGCTILVAFMILIPFTMIIVGAIYIDECRVEHVPAFLLIGGLVWATKNIIHCYAQCQPDEEHHLQQQHSLEQLAGAHSQPDQERGAGDARASLAELGQADGPPARARQRRRLKSSICESLLNCVLLGWFIAGCVIVFRNYEPDFENSASARYCHRTVYMYTFWLITSAILIFGLFIGGVCCLMVSSAVASRQEDELG